MHWKLFLPKKKERKTQRKPKNKLLADFYEANIILSALLSIYFYTRDRRYTGLLQTQYFVRPEFPCQLQGSSARGNNPKQHKKVCCIAATIKAKSSTLRLLALIAATGNACCKYINLKIARHVQDALHEGLRQLLWDFAYIATKLRHNERE